MISFETACAALNSPALGLANPVVRRGRELHCSLAAADTVSFAQCVCADLEAQLIAVAGEDARQRNASFVVHYLFANPGANWFVNAAATVGADMMVPSLAPFHLPASRFERELADLFGITAAGHPDPRRLVRHGFWPEGYYPLRKDSHPPAFTDDGQPFPFTPVGGEGVYEIPVGPVHAGVIEPGHFRFSVLGETIIDMKSRLYFTHKGTEKLFEGRLPHEGSALAERISGDTSVGHALAYAQAIESAAGVDVPPRARLLRVVLLELERMYNHVADFGAIANDTGFAVAHAHCYRIRERLLRVNKRLTGSRLLRGVVVPGGLTRDIAIASADAAEIAALVADFDEVAEICLGNTLLLDRLEGTGVLSQSEAVQYGVLGYVARASGIAADVRRDHPFAAYGDLDLEVIVEPAGDVKARALVRLGEFRESATLIGQAIRAMKPGDVLVPLGPVDPFVPAFGLVEGWRGRIVHWVMTGEDGRLHRVKVVDPSFFNWPALSIALSDNIVPDFPLCNKSFNQSYSGNDL